jgi:predicted metal-dependent phosphoesterase TrpH
MSSEPALKTVIHIHTNWSYDCNSSPADVLDAARAQGVDCVAITDHDQIGGALEARDLAERDGRRNRDARGGRERCVRVIVGEEITSAGGHIIGLFLRERIPPGLSVEDTARAIKDQGGLVLAPHPFAMLCDNSLHERLELLRPWVDAVEIFNAQNILPWEDARAARYVRRAGLTAYVGADTHLRGCLAAAYQVMPAFRNARDFAGALRQAEFYTSRFGLDYFARMVVRHIWDKFARQRLPGFGVNVPAEDRVPQPAR